MSDINPVVNISAGIFHYETKIQNTNDHFEAVITVVLALERNFEIFVLFIDFHF